VHCIEEQHGWPLSRFYKIDPEGDFQFIGYYIVGSSRWQKTPHYLSLYTLLMRSGWYGFEGPKRWNYDSVLETLHDYGRRKGDHLANIINCGRFDKMHVLLREQKFLVKRDMKTMYSTNRLARRDNGYNEGIYKILSGGTKDLRLSHRFRDACKQYGIRYTVNVKRDEDVLRGMV